MDGDQAADLMRSRGLEPLEPYRNANHKWRCRCTTCDREVAVPYNSIRLGTRGCRACSGYAVPPDEADSAMRAAGMMPLEPYVNARAPWRCECARCGRESSPTYFSVVKQGTGCVWCAGLRVDPAEAVEEMVAAGYVPLEDYPGANNPWPCRCMRCSRTIGMRLSNVRLGMGCKFCAGRAVDPMEAVAVMLENGLQPLETYPGRHAPWPSTCARCGRTVSPTYGAVKDGKSGCAYCSRKRVDPFGAIALLESRGVKALVPFPGVDVGWLSECFECGKEVTPRLSNVMLGRHPCKYCSGKEVDVVDAEAAMRQAGFDPLEPYPGADERWRCRCTSCGRASTPRLVSVRRHGTGCRYCADYGLDWAAPTIVYVMTHSTLGAQKIGIGKTNRARIRSHMSRGWELLGEVTMSSGDAAFEVEQAVLKWWRVDLGFPPYLSAEEMPKGGATETLGLDAVDAHSTWRLVRQLAASLDGESTSDPA